MYFAIGIANSASHS